MKLEFLSFILTCPVFLTICVIMRPKSNLCLEKIYLLINVLGREGQQNVLVIKVFGIFRYMLSAQKYRAKSANVYFARAANCSAKYLKLYHVTFIFTPENLIRTLHKSLFKKSNLSSKIYVNQPHAFYEHM